MIFWPKTTNSLFVDRLVAVLQPLAKANRAQIDMLLNQSPLEEEYDFEATKGLVGQAEAGLIPLATASRLLTREVSFGLASGRDIKALEKLGRALIPPLDGLSFYYANIQADLKQSHFPRTPAASRFTSPAASAVNTPVHSQPGSPVGSHLDLPSTSETHFHGDEGGSHPAASSRSILGLHSAFGRSSSPAPSLLGRRSHSRNPSHHAHRLRSVFHTPHIIQEARDVKEVGVFESLRYALFEEQLHTSNANPITSMFARLLGETGKDLFNANADAIDHVIGFLDRLNSERWQRFVDRFVRTKKAQAERGEGNAQNTENMVRRLESVLEDFRNSKRLEILEPFREAMQGRLRPNDAGLIPHRYLFQAWLHQFHLISFSERLLVLLRQVETLERERTYARFWGPAWPRLLSLESWRNSGEHDDSYDEDPNDIPNSVPDSQMNLG